MVSSTKPAPTGALLERELRAVLGPQAVVAGPTSGYCFEQTEGRGVRGIGDRHGLEACRWGHAGDGNLHSTLLIDYGRRGPANPGCVRSGEFERQWAGRALDLHEQIKHAFDPKGLFNPGKKTARSAPPAVPGELMIDPGRTGRSR